MRTFRSAALLSVVALSAAQDAVTLSSLRDRRIAMPPLTRKTTVGVILLDVEGEAAAKFPGPTLDDVRAFFEKISGGRLSMRFEPAGTETWRRPHDELAKIKTGSEDEIALLSGVFRAARAEHADVKADAYAVLVPHRGAERDHLLWPHAGRLTVAGRVTPFVVSWADAPVGVHAHELAHLLGLPDDYEHRSDDEGKWCLMSLGYRAGDPAGSEPSTLCAPCRTRLHWMDRIGTAEPRVAFDIDAAVDLELPEGRALVERRGDRFLVWIESRRNVSLKGEVTKDRSVSVAGATLSMSREGAAPALAWTKE